MAYHITQEQRDYYNANRRAKKAAETPEQREARLAKRREKYREDMAKGGEALRERTRKVALAWVNKKRMENPNWENERYKRSKYKKEQRAAERAKSVQPGERLCPRCLFVKLEEEFPMTRAGVRATVCRNCYKQITGGYDFESSVYWSNKARTVYFRAKRTFGEDPEKLTHVSGEDLRKLYEQQQHKCAYCGIELTPLILAVDHKIPKSKGGPHKIENLQLLCHNCNISKFTMTDEEYRKYIL